MSTLIRRFASPLLLFLFACADVAPANQSPSIVNAIPDHTLTIRTDSTIDISGYFMDADGDTLSYGAVSRDPGIVQVFINGSLLTMTAGQTPATSEIEVWASDPDSARATQTFRVTVMNQTPVVADTIPNHMLGARTDSTIDLSPYFTDPDGDALSYDVVSHDPATVSVSVDGSLLTMTAGPTLGTGEIEVGASDPDSARAVQVFEVTVINRAPVVADTIAPHRLFARTDSTIDLSPYFTDPDGDALSYDVGSGNPTTVSVSVQGSLLTLTAGDTPGASSEIEVRAFDPDSAQAAQTFRASVRSTSTSWRENFDSAGSLNGWRLVIPDSSGSIEVDEKDSVLLVDPPIGYHPYTYAARDDIVGVIRNWTASTRFALKSGSGVSDEVCSSFAVYTGDATYPVWKFYVDYFDFWWDFDIHTENGYRGVYSGILDDGPDVGEYLNITISFVNDTMTLIADDSTTLASFDPSAVGWWWEEHGPPPLGATGVELGAIDCAGDDPMSIMFDWVEIGEVNLSQPESRRSTRGRSQIVRQRIPSRLPHGSHVEEARAPLRGVRGEGEVPGQAAGAVPPACAALGYSGHAGLPTTSTLPLPTLTASPATRSSSPATSAAAPTTASSVAATPRGEDGLADSGQGGEGTVTSRCPPGCPEPSSPGVQGLKARTRFPVWPPRADAGRGGAAMRDHSRNLTTAGSTGSIRRKQWRSVRSASARTRASRLSSFAPAGEKRSRKRSSCFGLIEYTASPGP